MFHSLTRVGDLRRRTTSCWRKRRFSSLKPRAPREPRPDGEQQLGQKRDHRSLHYHTPIRVSSRITFSGGTTLVVQLPEPGGTLSQANRRVGRTLLRALVYIRKWLPGAQGGASEPKS